MKGHRMDLRRFTIVLFAVGFALAVAGCDWSMYAFGPAHSSYNPNESVVDIENVNTLQEAWTAVLGPAQGGSVTPVTSGAVVYATSDASPFELEAFNAIASDGCSKTPKKCRPLWTATTIGSADSLQVWNGLVYVTTHAGRLFVFDAAGVKGCSGKPKTCTPLWSASGLLVSSAPVPVITNRFVYAPVGNRVSAYDAAGAAGCSGAPKVCTPLWSVAGGSPAVFGAVLYVSRYAGSFEVGAYDAAGVRSCTGTPKTCAPLWIGRTSLSGDILNFVTSPTVSSGIVWFGLQRGDESAGGGALVGFAAGGNERCAGTPKVCRPIWQAPTSGVVYPAGVAHNVVYALDYAYSNFGSTRVFRMSAFDLTACRTTTLSCSPLWTASLGGVPQGLAIANGLVYVSTWDDNKITAYDATGVRGCSGTPKSCVPVWQIAVSGAPTAPIITNGMIYVGSRDDDILHAFALP
jgi:outer membrane protein assembly factor BamB